MLIIFVAIFACFITYIMLCVYKAIIVWYYQKSQQLPKNYDTFISQRDASKKFKN